MIHSDKDPKNLPLYVLIQHISNNVLRHTEYRGFLNIGEAKKFLLDNPNLILCEHPLD